MAEGIKIFALKFYAGIQLLPAMLAQRWWVVVLVLALTALFGRRVYCRFVCPLGIAQSVVRGFMGRRRICSRLDGLPIGEKGERGEMVRRRLVVRVAILAAFVVAGLVGLGWQWLDPYAIACRAACWFTSPEFDRAVALFALVPAAVVLLLAVFAGGRIWCNWVCPVGTLLALVGMQPWKGDKVKKCAGCEKCRRCFGGEG